MFWIKIDDLFIFFSQAELTDVLRKRRTRPDASDEDLGLPRSPSTPQKKERGPMVNMNQSEGSLSMLSTTSSDIDDADSSFSLTKGASDVSSKSHEAG